MALQAKRQPLDSPGKCCRSRLTFVFALCLLWASGCDLVSGSSTRRRTSNSPRETGSIHLASYATGQLLRSRKKECLVRLSGVSKIYRDTLFRDIDLSIETGDHIGLIGANGSGKTTLLRIIAGQVGPDSGTLAAKQNLACSEVAQNPQVEGCASVLETVMQGMPKLHELRSKLGTMLEKMSDPDLGQEQLEGLVRVYSDLDREYRLIGGYEAENRARMILSGLGLKEGRLEQQVGTLSGGEKTRAIIARSLLVEPDLLLLDEPTNHLDIQCMEWLEGFLRSLSCAYIVVSHDRSFLDATVSKVMELENGKASIYPGNYSKYKELKEQEVVKQAKDYELQQAKIRREEQVICFLKTLGVKKRRQAKSREKLLARVRRVEKPFKSREVRILFKPEFPGAQEAVQARELSKSFNAHKLFVDLSFTLRRGDKLGLIGPNGSGKTTLLRILAGTLQPDAGNVEIGPQVHLAVYDQELAGLDPQNTVFEEACQADPRQRDDSVRALLAAFLFRGHEAEKSVSRLSGGEKGRLALAKLVVSGANLLLLDEPTNHLDIHSREILEEALSTYRGTLVMASHDRRLMANVCNGLVVFGNGRAEVHNCDYQTYRRRQDSP